MKNDYANLGNIEYLEAAYQQWLKEPQGLDPAWRHFFEGFDIGRALPSSSLPTSKHSSPVAGSASEAETTLAQWRVDRLIHSYRDLGHIIADLNPLDSTPKQHADLELSRFGLSEADLQRSFTVAGPNGPQQLTLQAILTMLRETYCRSMGVEYMHIQDVSQRRWLQLRLEASRGQLTWSAEAKLNVLHNLMRADVFEGFVHSKFLGQKRFSLEGCEALIPALDDLRQRVGDFGVKELVIGMPHRGRLTVLANIVDKNVEEIFNQFEDNYFPEMVGAGSGDVKYHMGASCDFISASGKRLHISLASNPSHLEAVNPVALGRARGKQRRYDVDRKVVLPLLIHGDAALAGQGLVMECLQLSQLEGYTTGGTLHLVVNNQIGFTTDPDEGRSTRYCTDIAKMISAPIFHVNANDPEAVIYCMQTALEFRQQFGVDAFVDLIGFRKYGHNETDEPSYTQPAMYEQISKMPSTMTLYADKLKSQGVLTDSRMESMLGELNQKLERALSVVRTDKRLRATPESRGEWEKLQRSYSHLPVDTRVAKGLLDELVGGLFRWPVDFHLNKKIVKQLEAKKLAYIGNPHTTGTVDWGMAELLAFGSLLVEGVPVRLSGQDSRRGTFSHRHSVLFDALDGHHYIPLNFLRPKQEKFCVYNSPLSEAAVMGFDYGYSLEHPGMLILWEAQFGDFANGAQVIIDQFLASAEYKWQRPSGLVLLLPHGHEGMGPEHSSARLERFLQLCAEDNLQVCNFTTPAQYFHALRRQMRRNFRKPLVVMTPKSLLRHRLCVSSAQELSDGKFSEVLDDPQAFPEQIKGILFCSGKIYFELVQARDEAARKDIAIVRLEQLYPWPQEPLATIVSRYPKVEQLAWVQEEAKNNGAYSFVAPYFKGLGLPLNYIGRPAAASPAVGSLTLHKMEQEKIIQQAMSLTGQAARSVAKAGSSQ